MPRRRRIDNTGRKGPLEQGIAALCVLAMAIFVGATANAADDGSKRSQHNHAAPSLDILPVLGLAIREARNRLQRARAVCDQHAVGSARGGIAATLRLAGCFKTGVGRPKRLLRAKALFGLAAARGSAEAHLALGQFYRDGAIVPKDYRRAADHFRHAARAGLPEAMVEYGLVLRRARADHPAACAWFERSAHANARNGIRLLGDCFAYDVGGRRDRAYAKELYRRAARLGDGTARLKLAGHPFMGTGSDIARWEGCEWASRSAARNNIAAMQAAAYCLNAIR